ncbi:DNA cytosine methyltransferase, partial [bacterium]
MDALGCYIFAGGFTQGLSKHFNVVAHLEDKEYPGTLTSRANFPDIPIYLRSDGPWPVEQWRGIDLIFCNPPCAIFSPIGVSTIRGGEAWKTDRRLNCWLRCYQLLDIEPKILIIESVPQALTRGRPMIDALAYDAIQRGYAVTYLEHDAGNHGVPQNRKRFFFIAHQYDLNLRMPNFGPVTTVGEALAEVKTPGWGFELREDIGAVYPDMRKRANGKWEGLRVTWCRIHGIDVDARGVPGMPMFMLHRLSNEFPGGAFCGNYWLHPDIPRYLGINEYKVLCGYPEEYKMEGPVGWGPTLLAQAVLPPVGEFVGASMKQTLESGQKISSSSVKISNIRTSSGSIIDLTSKITEQAYPRPELLSEDLPTARGAPRMKIGNVPVSHEWLEKKVTFLVEGNPRRPGSITYEIYKLYEAGGTIRDFVTKGGR